jgi:hypothetical protein
LFAIVPFATIAIAQSGIESSLTRSELESLLHVPAADYQREWVLLGSFSVRADDPEFSRPANALLSSLATFECTSLSSRCHRATGGTKNVLV